MKKIGLVGGISWTSTLDYYRYFNEGINAQLGKLNFAECIIYSVNFGEYSKHNAKYDWDGAYKILFEAATKLKAAGADCILLGANTAHVVADRLAANIDLPLLQVTTAVSDAIHKKGLSKVGLLGTIYTMELDFYKDKLRHNGIEPIIPESKEERVWIEDVLRDELGKGILNPETKKGFIKMMDQLIQRGAEGIILGCTEIPLIIKQEDVAFPVFDTTYIHAMAAVEFALKETGVKA
jgi:aspartate racemase